MGRRVVRRANDSDFLRRVFPNMEAIRAERRSRGKTSRLSLRKDCPGKKAESRTREKSMTPEKDQFREKWGEIMNSKKHHKFAAGISFLILFALMIVPVPANAGTSDNDPASGSAPVEARTIPDNRFGQVTGQGDELTPEKKKAIVKRVATEFRDKYVFADMGEKMANYIERQEVQGIYDSLAAVKPFAPS